MVSIKAGISIIHAQLMTVLRWRHNAATDLEHSSTCIRKNSMFERVRVFYSLVEKFGEIYAQTSLIYKYITASHPYA